MNKKSVPGHPSPRSVATAHNTPHIIPPPKVKMMHINSVTFNNSFARLGEKAKTELLRKLHTKEATEFIHPLKRIIVSHREDKFVRILAAKALERVGTVEAAKALEEALLELGIAHHKPGEYQDLRDNITQSIHTLSQKLRSKGKTLPGFIK